MASHLLNIPTEMKVSIFASCDDLDDAFHLMQTCKDLRTKFQKDRKRIEKAIIVRSDKSLALLVYDSLRAF